MVSLSKLCSFLLILHKIRKFYKKRNIYIFLPILIKLSSSTSQMGLSRQFLDIILYWKYNFNYFFWNLLKFLVFLKIYSFFRNLNLRDIILQSNIFTAPSFWVFQWKFKIIFNSVIFETKSWNNSLWRETRLYMNIQQNIFFMKFDLKKVKS